MQLGFNLLATEPIEDSQEDVKDVMKEISSNCIRCRLGHLHPTNRGMIYRGNINAKIAVVGIAPGDTETERGTAMIGKSGQMFEQWLKHIGLDANRDVFITNVIQCQPPKKKINGKMKQRDPERDEINACFGPRCLRVLRAMPNLDVVITLGWLAAKIFLGTQEDTAVPKTKTHEGQWFESSLLPGKAIFCLSHPAELLHKNQYSKEEASEERLNAIKVCLEHFKREYMKTRKVMDLAGAARKDREALGLGMF